jgi:hypothetical protein
VCRACDAEAGSQRSRKLYYLDVTFLNINKAFPYQKKTCDENVGTSKSTEYLLTSRPGAISTKAPYGAIDLISQFLKNKFTRPKGVLIS